MGGGGHKGGTRGASVPLTGSGSTQKSHYTYELHKVRRRRDAFPHFAPTGPWERFFFDWGVLSWADKQKKKKKNVLASHQGCCGGAKQAKKKKKKKRSLPPTRGCWAELTSKKKKKKKGLRLPPAPTRGPVGGAHHNFQGPGSFWVQQYLARCFTVLPLWRKFPFWGEI